MPETCRAELIAVGSEILLGQINNSHAQTISQSFAQHGFFVFHHSSVGDNQTRIEQAFALAARRSNVVIVTGGLGPTVDDLTKEALASHLQRPLELSAQALATLELFFAGRKRKMPQENMKQAYCISGGTLLVNPNGTAPGQYICDNGVHYFLLPGPPLEMKPMLEDSVIPQLKQIFSHRKALVSRILHFCGVGESEVDELVVDLTANENPTVAPLAGEGEMLLRITATDATEEAAMQLVQPVERELRQRLGRFIYGIDDDTLPIVVGRSLLSHGDSLAVAESCTGGLVASMLTAIPGSSAWFYGGVVAYDNRVKTAVLDVSLDTLQAHGAVSEQTAAEMALGVRARCGTTYGISLTGVAGPSGGTAEKPVGLVYIGVSTPSKTNVYRLQFRGSREQVRIRAAKQALWRLWSAIETPNANT